MLLPGPGGTFYNLFPTQVRMGITGVVRDKDTELGIADAVIAVEGINHDVTTGVYWREWCGGNISSWIRGRQF